MGGKIWAEDYSLSQRNFVAINFCPVWSSKMEDTGDNFHSWVEETTTVSSICNGGSCNLNTADLNEFEFVLIAKMWLVIRGKVVRASHHPRYVPVHTCHV